MTASGAFFWLGVALVIAGMIAYRREVAGGYESTVATWAPIGAAFCGVVAILLAVSS